MKLIQFVIVSTIFFLSFSNAQELTSYSYDIGSPSVIDYYVDPNNGSDSASGTSINTAWKSVEHAWNEIPSSITLTQGFRINLMNGTYDSDLLPNYWEQKVGTATYPIILKAASGQTAVKFTRDINMANVSYFYLIGVEITPTGGGDAFHCESCNHLLIRGCVLNGGSKTTGAHETVKINQSQYVYLENNNILYADDNNIDFVAVQYGHVIGNKVHEAADWCMYVKGGSSYIRVESNQFYNCGTGGFTAGQGSGFQFMTSPWLHYEAYNIKFINNIIHDTEGAAFGVNGGYNILMAHNSAYKVGTRDHLVEVVFGERTCDGESNGQIDTTCASFNSSGGWGPATVRLDPEPIGNRNVYILNNIIYNPSGTVAPSHFAIYGTRTPSGDVNLSTPQYSDTNLSIKGNVIWNGDSTPLGIEDSSQGCQDSNTTCNASQLNSENYINSYEPQLQAASSSDFRPTSGATLISMTPASLSDFTGGDLSVTPSVDQGVLTNSFTRDFSGVSPSGTRIIGAFASADSANTPPTIDGVDIPSNNTVNKPTINSPKVTAKRAGKKVTITATATITSDVTLSSKTVSIKQNNKTLGTFSLKGTSSNKYTGKKAVSAKARKKLTISFIATNSAGTTTKNKSLTSP